MKITKPNEITMVAIDQIEVGERIRPLDPAAVKVIAASVADLGHLTTPIHVRKTRNGYELIDGRHRLAVAEHLGMPEIPARVWECLKEEARLMEGDANLSIAHLTPMDIAINLAARKKAYQALHPETKRGVAGALVRNGEQKTTLSFADFIADVVGRSSRNVSRWIRAGENLTPDDLEALRPRAKELTHKDLEALAKIGEADERQFVVRALASGEAKGVAKARKAFKGNAAPVLNPSDVAFDRLADLFNRSNKDIKKRFVEFFENDLRDLLDEVE